jgi:hypothetical protein
MAGEVVKSMWAIHDFFHRQNLHPVAGIYRKIDITGLNESKCMRFGGSQYAAIDFSARTIYLRRLSDAFDALTGGFISLFRFVKCE